MAQSGRHIDSGARRSWSSGHHVGLEGGSGDSRRRAMSEAAGEVATSFGIAVPVGSAIDSGAVLEKSTTCEFT